MSSLINPGEVSAFTCILKVSFWFMRAIFLNSSSCLWICLGSRVFCYRSRETSKLNNNLVSTQYFSPTRYDSFLRDVITTESRIYSSNTSIATTISLRNQNAMCKIQVLDTGTVAITSLQVCSHRRSMLTLISLCLSCGPRQMNIKYKYCFSTGLAFLNDWQEELASRTTVIF